MLLDICVTIFILCTEVNLLKQEQEEDIYKDARHIYTKRLIASIPQINPESREELKQRRENVEKEYEKLYSQFYDKNGKVFDLEKNFRNTLCSKLYKDIIIKRTVINYVENNT